MKVKVDVWVGEVGGGTPRCMRRWMRRRGIMSMAVLWGNGDWGDRSRLVGCAEPAGGGEERRSAREHGSKHELEKDDEEEGNREKEKNGGAPNTRTVRRESDQIEISRAFLLLHFLPSFLLIASERATTTHTDSAWTRERVSAAKEDRTPRRTCPQNRKAKETGTPHSPVA